MSESRNPILEYDPEPKKDYVELGGGFILELHELLAGNELQRLDDTQAQRKKARAIIQTSSGVNITEGEVDDYCWVEACCRGVWKGAKLTEAGIEGGERVADGIEFTDVVKASAKQKDLLRLAGLKAWALTTGVDLEAGKKKTVKGGKSRQTDTSGAEVTGSGNSNSYALTSDAPSEPPLDADSLPGNSTTLPTPE